MRLDPIVIVPFDPTWAASFENERERVTTALGDWLARPLEHMGSTAVPGLAAKPIIDMLAVVDRINGCRDAAARMAAIGWVHAPEPFDDADRKLSFCSPSVERRTHHLHVVEFGSTGWCDWLTFRDALRADPDARDAYAELKEDLAARFGANPNARDEYRGGKHDFIRRCVEEARAEQSAE